MKNILISTGGSGGHVVPATVIYDHLKSKFNIFMTCDYRGIKYLDRSKYNTEIINVPKLSKNFFLLFKIFLLPGIILKSFLFLRNKKIEILISTGGYMSLPLCIAARILNIKLFLFEPNMILGRSNRLFINSCKKIFCYSLMIENFPINLKNKISVVPALLRKDFYSKKIAKDINQKINLLIIGGSQGAKSFDSIINESIVKLSNKYELKVFQQTNSNNFKNLKKFYLKYNIENEMFDFNEDISNFMTKTNICITRAGASTLAELVHLNVPHVAIPLLTAKDNHQFENASFYERHGCSWIINQNEINNNNLAEKLISIIDNKDEYLDKKKNMKNFSYQNTWNGINQKIINIINEN
jgi:UDP-N-acetylglucosamine--N-acetylmuramyl-(pentapeptide) pyrophosphoryl-undecaprenol N-acetylglucosamine transferase